MKPQIRPSAEPAPVKKEPAVGYMFSQGIPELFTENRLSLVISTYQAQRILVLAPRGERMNMLMRVFERPTGLRVEDHRMALMTKRQVWTFALAGELRAEDGSTLPYDRCFVPRQSYVTGDIAGHELAWKGDDLWIVNTRFSCICKPSSKASFEVLWKPPFITEVAPDDRCHLNGMAWQGEDLRYVSALGSENRREQWRENKADGGIIMNYPDGEIVARGFSMPHSPRLYADKLWVLNSGAGELCVVDPASGQWKAFASFPGYLRGLAFYKHLCFVGLCKAREKSTFGGIPLENRIDELICGVYVLDLRTAQVAGFIQFTKGIEELFDIGIVAGSLFPHVIGFEDDTIDGVFILP